ncbi:MAG TPA: lysophospholipid acyltransferase family protein, partial [Aeromicrobium sp.]|nr:lysophospholipid acyltransferase family protein [Aeromicrobium sp.]
MWGCKVIPVDRSLGHDAYVAAVERLRGGELVGVYPEATVSRSFEIKALKTGAARMSLESGAPIIPAIVWGSQRIATKGQPKALGRTRTPVVVAVGPAIQPEGDVESLTPRLHDEMTALLHEAQEAYSAHPAGEFWVPARMGGSAPTLKEADVMDLAEMDEKDRIRAKMRKKKRR